MVNLEPGERVILTVRPHWFVLIRQTFGLFLLALVPLLLFFVPDVASRIGVTFSFGPLTTFFVSSWWLLLWTIFMIMWTNYYLDAWVVTDRRIIDIEQYGFWNRKVSECRLDRVQDISAEVKGFFRTILGFGSVYIQTAAEAERFIMKDVPNPNGVKDAIFDAHPPVVAPGMKVKGE